MFLVLGQEARLTVPGRVAGPALRTKYLSALRAELLSAISLIVESAN